jgi:transposase
VEDTDSGALFAFTNKRRNRIKVFWFDGNGHCILYKRLHRQWA